MLSVEQRAQRELDLKNADLSEKIDKAKLEQIEVHFQQDLELLKKRMPTAQSEAVESAKDQAYLRDRQKSLVVRLVSLTKQLCFFLMCTKGWGIIKNTLPFVVGHVVFQERAKLHKAMARQPLQACASRRRHGAIHGRVWSHSQRYSCGVWSGQGVFWPIQPIHIFLVFVPTVCNRYYSQFHESTLH